MSDTRATRFEVVSVAATFVVAVLLYRWAWTSPYWETFLEGAAETWGLPVTGVGRWFSAWTLGDGQAFAVIASDPLGLEAGTQISQPAYRYGRAGFGWLVWVASFGRAQLIPYGMAAVGVLALIGSFVLAWRLRPGLGRAAWLIALNPATLIGFAGDTAETVAVFLLAFAMASSSRLASVALGVVRPTYVVALIGRLRVFWWGAGAAALFGVFWILRFGFDLSQYGGRLTLPLVGYLAAPSAQSIGLAVFAGLTLIVGIKSRNWAWILSGAFVLCFASEVVAEAVNGWRAGGMLFLLWAFGPAHRPGAEPRKVEDQWSEISQGFMGLRQVRPSLN